MFGIGIDICEVHRFDRLKEKKGFLEKIYSQEEIDYCMANKTSSQNLAVRFAAKESFLKALGTGLRKGVHLKEIIIEKDELGKPYIKLIGETRETFDKMGLSRIQLSLSHEKNNAIALVIIEE
jgi:holo-[acyl-carrier protein] synthase